MKSKEKIQTSRFLALTSKGALMHITILSKIFVGPPFKEIKLLEFLFSFVNSTFLGAGKIIYSQKC